MLSDDLFRNARISDAITCNAWRLKCLDDVSGMTHFSFSASGLGLEKSAGYRGNLPTDACIRVFCIDAMNVSLDGQNYAILRVWRTGDLFVYRANEDDLELDYSHICGDDSTLYVRFKVGESELILHAGPGAEVEDLENLQDEKVTRFVDALRTVGWI